MPRTRIALSLAVTAASLVLAQPASAHHGCSKHARGGKVTHKTKEAHVFEKNDHWYGCATKVGRPKLLPGLDSISAVRDFGDGTGPTYITLSGVFVAYERETVLPAGGAGDNQTDLYVVDLRTGKVVVDEDATPPSGVYENRYVTDIALKRNGSVGWISARSYPQYYEVHRVSRDPAAPGEATVVDAGYDIDPESLALSADRKTMRWTKGGKAQSAPLP